MFDEKDFENEINNEAPQEEHIHPVTEDSVEDVAENEPVYAQIDEQAIDGIYSDSEDYTPYTYVEPKKKKDNRFFRVVAIAVVFGLVAGIVFGASNYLTSRFISKNIKINTTESVLSKSDGTNTADSSVAEITEACMPSIVAITNKSVKEIMTFFGNYAQESTSNGSGIIIGKNDTELLIVSNYHVVSESNELSVVFSHSEGNAITDDTTQNPAAIAAKIKGYDIDKDLAVIAVNLEDINAEILAHMKVATIGDSNALRAGEQVVAIGNALGYGQSVTTGIISAVNREVTMQTANGGTVTNTFIQTDAAINPGNSGGALLNMRGELIGINSVKIASSGVEGMGYAIPITDVENIINDLMVMETRDVVDEDKQGYMGIVGQDVTSSVSESYGLPIGVYVQEVQPGSAADKAGIKAGHIITKFDGTTVSSMAELQNRLSYYAAGETATVTVKVQSTEGYTESELTITLDKRPADTGTQQENENPTIEIPGGLFGN